MERDASMYFRFSELLNQEKEVKVQDEVQFTVAKVTARYRISKSSTIS